MPCMGPSIESARREAVFVAEHLYPILKDLVESECPSYFALRRGEKIVKRLFMEIKNYTQSNLYGSEFNRYKYLLWGFLQAKLENEEYTRVQDNGLKWSALRINSRSFNFTEHDLVVMLTDLFFVMDMEDF